LKRQNAGLSASMFLSHLFVLNYQNINSTLGAGGRCISGAEMADRGGADDIAGRDRACPVSTMLQAAA